jgi:uncharacterized protein YkwD
MQSATGTRRTRRAPAIRLPALVVLAAIVLATLATAAPPASAGARRALRNEMLDLTNRSRIRRGLHRVHINYRISRKATRHSAKMARRRRLFHTRNVGAYLRGINWHCWGENVGFVSSSLERLQKKFMRSRAHRHNILNRRFHRVGLGVVQRRGRYWATIFFYG